MPKRRLGTGLAINVGISKQRFTGYKGRRANANSTLVLVVSRESICYLYGRVGSIERNAARLPKVVPKQLFTVQLNL